MDIQRFLLLFSVFIVAGCGNHNQNGNTDVTLSWTPEASEEWPVATPEEMDVDRELLQKAYNDAAKRSYFQSLIVIRNGYLVGESYFQGTNSSQRAQVRSVTKTVMSLLVGKAIEEGFLEGIEEPIGPYFIEDFPDMGLDKQAITLGNLLTMTSGFQWDESSSNGYNQWESSSDPIGYVLKRPLIAVPGEKFTYNSGAVHLLSAIISKATEMSTLDYANKVLFVPMGFGQVSWNTLADGYANGGAGLLLRPRDMAKLGKMFLEGGRFNDSQIVNSQWIHLMRQPTRMSQVTYGPLTGIDYGLLWWLGSAGDEPIQLAWGWGGQFIATFPQKKLIIITTSNWRVQAGQADHQETENLNLMVHEILPAVY